MYVNDNLDYMKFLKDKTLIVFGAGERGVKAAKKLVLYGFDVAGFCDNDPQKKDRVIDSVKVIGNLSECMKIMGNKVIYILAGRFRREMKAELIENGCTYVDYDEIDFGHCDIDYYDEDYFEWQKEIGKFTARFDSEQFSPYISAEDVVVEFGSGTGYLLKEINAKEKMGIEINDSARAHAAAIGIDSVKDVSMIRDGYADVIISTHVLEHVDNPLGILKELHKKLKTNGKILFIVPYECTDSDYYRNDINQHLYTWSGLLLGNLFNRAGFFVNKVESFYMQWPYGSGYYNKIYEETGKDTLMVISELFGESLGMKNIFIMAKK